MAGFKFTRSRKLPSRYKKKRVRSKSPYNYKERKAFWTGFGARLVRHKNKGSNNLLRGYYNGKYGTSFKNGIAAADKLRRFN